MVEDSVNQVCAAVSLDSFFQVFERYMVRWSETLGNTNSVTLLHIPEAVIPQQNWWKTKIFHCW